MLLVDDDAAVRSSLKFALEVEGFEVRLFAGAKALLAEAALPARSCLVVDYEMPGIDGLEMIRMLRTRGVRLPAILITGGAGERLRDRAGRAGVGSILEKPLSDTALIECIRRAVATGA